MDFCSELFSPSLNCQSAAAQSRLLLKGKKRSDLICRDSCQSLRGLINVFLLIAPCFQHSVTVAIRWQKNQLPHPVRLHHYKNRAPDELQLLIFALPSHISSKPTAVVGSANRKCTACVQEGSDQQTVSRIAHAQPFMNWVQAESSMYDINWQQVAKQTFICETHYSTKSSYFLTKLVTESEILPVKHFQLGLKWSWFVTV